ncbi:MAG: hypothetical protein PUJ55_14730 [Clostridiales bacterium]|nr:hypothetical protein [Clostridiales bacterium]MDY4113658.1 hypothetical protein [Roseburia sp.]
MSESIEQCQSARNHIAVLAQGYVIPCGLIGREPVHAGKEVTRVALRTGAG